MVQRKADLRKDEKSRGKDMMVKGLKRTDAQNRFVRRLDCKNRFTLACSENKMCFMRMKIFVETPGTNG